MKYQSAFPYHVHPHFESPIWDFLEDKKNKETINQIFDQRFQPKILISYEKTKDKGWQMDYLRALQFGFPVEFTEEGLLVSGLYMITKRIIDLSALRFKGYKFDENIVSKILLGLMSHEYYTTGKYGEALFDVMDQEFEESPNKNMTKHNGAIQNWTMMIPLYTENIGTDIREAYKAQIFLYKKILKGEEVVFKYPKKVLQTGALALDKKETLKFTEEGIDLLRLKGLDPNIVKGFQQVRIVRKFELNPTLFLFSIVAAVYSEEELFMSFDPFYFDIHICDKEGISCRPQSINFLLNFNDLIHSIFCSCCIEKLFGKYKIKDKKTLQNKDNIKAMMDDLYNMICKVNPNELTITAEGKLKHTDEFVKLKEALPFATVGYEMYNGKPTKSIFVIKKDLKKNKKRLPE